jgi:hypothetical protein
VRNPLVILIVRPPPAAAAASRSVFAASEMYGSTAEPVNAIPVVSANGTSWPGMMQSTSSAICVDSASTTLVAHELVSNDDTGVPSIDGVPIGPASGVGGVVGPSSPHAVTARTNNSHRDIDPSYYGRTLARS